MRVKLFLISLVVLSFYSCSEKEGNIRLSGDHKSQFSIIVDSKADSLTHKAALEIQKYIYKVSKATLPVVHQLKNKEKYILIGKKFIKDSSLLNKISKLKKDGFIIRSGDNSIIIAGNNPKANLYGVYTFLEDFIGCTMLSLNEYYIPDNPDLFVPKIDKTYEPAFELRKYFKIRPSTKPYMDWHKLNGLEDWGLFVHTFDDLVPPGKYFKQHPEYFALVGGRILMDGQLCLSNPELINTLKENLKKEIEKNPEKKYWSVSQNDCYNYCECDNCKKLYKKYGAISGAYINMVNQIAKEFPEKIISTLAYQFTRSAPKNIKPLSNVNVMFCSIECNRSQPLAQDERSRSFINDLNNWTKLTGNIFMWDYVVQFKNYLTPFPNIKVLQPNIQLFRDKKIPMAFQQGSDKTWSDLSELKQFLIAKLLWNPDANVDSLTDDFLIKYYGPAASYIKEYYELTHKALYDHPEEWLNIYGFPMDYTDSYLTEELLIKYKNIMDNAKKSVQKDSVYLKRVLRAGLPVDFAYLDIALNGKFPRITFIEDNGKEKHIKKEMLDYLDTFVKNSKLTGATRINERNFLTEDYRKYVIDKLHRMVKKNLAQNANISLKTKYSEKYPVGGEKALVDGLFGDLDFHHNWLGFEGNDMIAVIEFDNALPVSSVEMNFLKAVNSWVFLPVEVKIEISDDGKNYIKIASVKGNISDKSYLVKSVPFIFKFDTTNTRFMKISATSMKTCPKWHRGYGKPSWIFVDEIIVE